MNNNKPLASLCILFYNQEKYVKDAVEGALSQTYSNLEIVLTDDCSTDGTFEQINNCIKDYKGPHKIIVNRNEHNVGLVPHVNEVIYKISSGKYIFLTGGDDISLPNRVADGVRYFEDNQDLSMVTFSTIFINKDGEEIGCRMVNKDELIRIQDKEYLCSSGFMAGLSGQGFRRDVLEEYGPMGDAQTEDSVLRFRSILRGPILISSKVGLKYRFHNDNMSAPSRIYHLQTQKMAEQYKKDLDTQKWKLSKELFGILERKIKYYVTYRDISERQFKNTHLKWLYRLQHFLLRKHHEYRVVIFLKS